MQSPAARELTVSVTVLENWVVGVQLTVVWPVLGFCTSMLDAAERGHAAAGADGRGRRAAAPAVEADGRGGQERRGAGAEHLAQRRPVELRLVSVCIVGGSLSFLCML